MASRRGKLPEGIFKRYDKYYVRWIDGIGRERQCAASDRLEHAIMIRDEKRRESWLEKHGLGHAAKQRIPLSKLRDEYLVDLETRVTPEHLKNVQSFLDLVLSLLAAPRVSDLRLEAVMRVREGFVKSGDANKTVNEKIGSLVAMLQWAASTGRIGASPIPRFRRLPTKGLERRRRHRLTVVEAQKLVDAARALDVPKKTKHPRPKRVKPNVPQAPLLQFMLETGVRLKEATLLCWGYLSCEGKEWWVTVPSNVAKTKRERRIPLSDSIVVVLAEMKSVQYRRIGRIPGDTDPVFVSMRGRPFASRNARRCLSRWLDRVIDRAGLPKLYPDGSSIDLYSTRHSFATIALSAGVDLATVQAIMGHSTPAMTMAYVDQERTRKREAIEHLEKHRAVTVLKETKPAETVVSQGDVGG